jgi:hypothetical protein
MFVLSARKEESHNEVLGLRVGFFFALAGLLTLVSFLRGGDSTDGFMASTFLGFAARELYVYRIRKSQ